MCDISEGLTNASQVYVHRGVYPTDSFFVADCSLGDLTDSARGRLCLYGSEMQRKLLRGVV